MDKRNEPDTSSKSHNSSTTGTEMIGAISTCEAIYGLITGGRVPSSPTAVLWDDQDEEGQPASIGRTVWPEWRMAANRGRANFIPKFTNDEPWTFAHWLINGGWPYFQMFPITTDVTLLDYIQECENIAAELEMTQSAITIAFWSAAVWFSHYRLELKMRNISRDDMNYRMRANGDFKAFEIMESLADNASIVEGLEGSTLEDSEEQELRRFEHLLIAFVAMRHHHVSGGCNAKGWGSRDNEVPEEFKEEMERYCILVMKRKAAATMKYAIVVKHVLKNTPDNSDIHQSFSTQLQASWTFFTRGEARYG